MPAMQSLLPNSAKGNIRATTRNYDKGALSGRILVLITWSKVKFSNHLP
jgi:hypothetical protein